jgi:hypothetical protein
MPTFLRPVIVGAAFAVMLTPAGIAVAKDGERGATPFGPAATIDCAGTIHWSVLVGDGPAQAVWVKIDFDVTIAIERTPDQGVYTGFADGFDATVAHTALFRRLDRAVVEEQAIVDVVVDCPVEAPPALESPVVDPAPADAALPDTVGSDPVEVDPLPAEPMEPVQPTAASDDGTGARIRRGR